MPGPSLSPVVPLKVLLAPEYVLGLGGLSMTELRERRTHCALIESSVSYERQLIQGRLDIVRDEQHRRHEAPDPAGAGGLVDRLPEILTLHAHAAGVGRPPTFMYPVQLDVERQERMNLIAPASTIGALPMQSSDDLSTMSDLLEGMEQQISTERRALHVVFDHIQEEVIRRYKSGEEPIDSAFED